MANYLPRTLEKIFLKANNQFKALMISGMRQVGKTTLLTHLKQANREFVSLDDLMELEDARHQPTIFFKNHPMPLYL
ncbi:MAG: ATP-binding protein, partial [Burkholderiaceae bacterium]|nr:ATP-binding protein [Burkholderiaceae bacterium]